MSAFNDQGDFRSKLEELHAAIEAVLDADAVPHPDAIPSPDPLHWVREAYSHLGAALIQALPSDDQTILNHVRAAHTILEEQVLKQ